MMVVWGNQRFSAIRADYDTIIKGKVNNIDMSRVSFFILLSSIYVFSLISPIVPS